MNKLRMSDFFIGRLVLMIYAALFLGCVAAWNLARGKTWLGNDRDAVNDSDTSEWFVVVFALLCVFVSLLLWGGE
jgi:hypothetical protein